MFSDNWLYCITLYVNCFSAHRLVPHCVQGNEAYYPGKRPSGRPETHVWYGKLVPLSLHWFSRTWWLDENSSTAYIHHGAVAGKRQKTTHVTLDSSGKRQCRTISCLFITERLGACLPAAQQQQSINISIYFRYCLQHFSSQADNTEPHWSFIVVALLRCEAHCNTDVQEFCVFLSQFVLIENTWKWSGDI